MVETLLNFISDSFVIILTNCKRFTYLQRSLFIGLALIILGTILGVRTPFLTYLIVILLTFAICTKALCSDHYVTVCHGIARDAQNSLYDLLDDHPADLRPYTFYRTLINDDVEPKSLSGGNFNQMVGHGEDIGANHCSIPNGHSSQQPGSIDHLSQYKIEVTKMVQHIFKDFILSWYLTISDELTFAQNLHVLLEELVLAIEGNLHNIDRFEVAKCVITMYTNHIAEYQQSVSTLKTQPKFRKHNVTFTKLKNVVDVYEKKQQFHHALASDDTELTHLRSVLSVLIHKLVPAERLSSIVGINIVIEVLAQNVLQPLLVYLSNPDNLYELLIKILAIDEASIMTEIRNMSESLPNGGMSHSESDSERIETEQIPERDKQRSKSTLSRLEEIVDIVTARSRQFFQTQLPPEMPETECDEDVSTDYDRSARAMSCFEDISIQDICGDSTKSFVLGPSVEVISSLESDEWNNDDFNLLKFRCETNVSNYLMIVAPDDDTDPVLQSSVPEMQGKLRRCLTITKEERKRKMSRQSSLPSLPKTTPEETVLLYDAAKANCCSCNERCPSCHVMSKSLSDVATSEFPPSFSETNRKTLSLQSMTDLRKDEDSSSIKNDEYLTDVMDNVMDNVSLSSGDVCRDDDNTLPDRNRNPIKLATDYNLLRDSLSSLPDVTSSTSLFENLYVVGTEAMQEYGNPENQYVCYVIQYDGWYFSGSGLTRVPRVVRRRFREFVALQERLNENPICRGLIKGIKSPNRWWTLPFNKLDAKIVEKRKLFLQQYLQALIKKQPLAVSQEVKEFLAYDSDASLAFVRRTADMPAQWIDKVFLKTFTGVFDRLSTAMPSLPIVTPVDTPSTAQRAEQAVTSIKRRLAREAYAEILPETDDDNLDLDFMIVSDTEKMSVSRLPLSVMTYLSRERARASDVMASDVASTYDVSSTPAEKGSELIFARSDSNKEHHHTATPSTNNDYAQLFSDIPLARAVLDLGAQLTKDCRLTFYNEQILGVFYVLLGCYFDRFLRSEIVDLSCERMIGQYLQLLRTALWPPEPEVAARPKSAEQLAKTREMAAKCLRDFFPWFIPLAIGSDNLSFAVELVMASLEHSKLNRHLILCLLDLIIDLFIPNVAVENDVTRNGATTNQEHKTFGDS